ncbi:MAG: biphenyl 2,3-dioxygenase [Defluviimonas sp.]|nr:biphenyl 2,3-dioxygenase [Defluviimonas sp.]
MEPARAVRFLETLGLRIDGKVTIAAEMPVGGGAGASTAALVALARVAGHAGPPPALAAACVRNEGASDPLMFPRPERLLWASREARIVEGFPALPRMEVVGGFFGPNRRTVAADARFPDIADLVDRWRTAAGAADAPALAALASDSARRTLALRGPSGDPTEALAERLGACGFAIAHTGSARALLFRPGTSGKTAESELIRAGFRQVVRFTVGGFA